MSFLNLVCCKHAVSCHAGFQISNKFSAETWRFKKSQCPSEVTFLRACSNLSLSSGPKCFGRSLIFPAERDVAGTVVSTSALHSSLLSLQCTVLEESAVPLFFFSSQLPPSIAASTSPRSTLSALHLLLKWLCMLY